MIAQTQDWSMHIRIVWSMMSKDLLEAIRNKNTISVLLSGLFIVVMYRMLPTITGGSDPVRVWIHDPAQSARVTTLEDSQVINARTGVDSLDRLKELVRDADRPELGLALPPDLDEQLEAGMQVVLQGYLMHWLGEQEAGEMIQSVQREVSELLGGQVLIQTEGNILYLRPGSSGPGVQAALGAVFLLAMVGMSLVPHLIMAEKQEHTLEVLLVSPASETHVVVAKALTGMVYALIGGAIVLVLNQAIVLHWWLAVLALVCFSLFSIAVGLALGSKIETRAQLSLWSWVIFIPLFIPAMAVLLEGLIPEGVIAVLRFTPTVAFTTALRCAFAQPISPMEPLAWLAFLLLWAGASLGVAVWLIRRRDRHVEAGAKVRASKPSIGDTGGMAAPSRVSARSAWQEPAYAATAAVGAATRAQSPRGEGFPSMRPSRARIVWAIFVKDMREALSNRLLLSILIGTALVVLNGSVLPLLLERGSTPSAVIWDQGQSALLRELMRNDEVRILPASSQQELEENITAGPGTWLGLALPADFDERITRSEAIQLEGYVAHWGDDERILRFKASFEELFSQAAVSEVHIDLAGHVVFPTVDVGGQISINLVTVMIAVTAIGAALVPLLLVEEKETHTLDTMLVSPAGYGEVLLGKTLVGGTYGLLAFAVGFLINQHYVVHWDLALLAALLSVAFVVSLGMLIGILSDNPTSAAMWTAPAIMVVLLPTVAQFFIRSDLPALVANVLDWMPGTLMVNLFRTSVAGEVPVGLIATNAGALAGMAAVLYLVVNWRIRVLDR